MSGSHSGRAQHSTDQAVLRALSRSDSPGELLQRLSGYLRGWSILLDATGEPEEAEPAEAVRHLPVVRMEYDRLSRGGQQSTTWSDQHTRAVLTPVSSGSQLLGYLAVGTDVESAAGRMEAAIDVAGNLLAFQIDKANAVRRAERLFRTAIVQLLLTGLHREADLAARQADLPLPGPVVRVAVATHVDGAAETPVDRISDLIERDLPLAAADALSGDNDGGGLLVVLSAVEGDQQALTRIALRLDGIRIALSEAVDVAELPRAAREVQRLAASVTRDSPLVTTRSSAHGHGLLAHIDTPDVRAFVANLLAPIAEADERGSIDLMGTLHVFLACDGRAGEASERLGIHRHTLRYRIKKLETLLGRRLDHVGTRAELWIALKLSDS